MMGALQDEGTALGVLADSLMRTATSEKYRKHIMAGDLVLASPFNPEAGFNVGNAMARNRYIYCPSDAAVVISSTPDKGGTWNGATENLKAQWIPLWLKRTDDTKSGNPELVNRGGHWLPKDLSNLGELTSGELAEKQFWNQKPDLPLLQDDPRTPVQEDQKPTTNSQQNYHVIKPAEKSRNEFDLETAPQQSIPAEIDFYGMFLHKLEVLISSHPLTSDEICECLVLVKSQTNAWLKRAATEKKVKKLNKPVRYQWRQNTDQQKSLFGGE